MSCCGFVLRVLALVLLVCFTVCAILSNFLALFRRTETLTGDITLQSVVTYWYLQSKASTGSEDLGKLRVYTNDFPCDAHRRTFTAMCALSVVAAILGALAALFMIFWMLPCCRCAMGAMVFTFTLLAGLCCASVFGMSTWGFFNYFCPSSPELTVPALSDNEFSMVEGYALLCVAGLGFLLMALMEAIAFCCVCCGCASSSSKASGRAEGRTEPTHEDYEKEAPRGNRSTGDCTPYAKQKE